MSAWRISLITFCIEAEVISLTGTSSHIVCSAAWSCGTRFVICQQTTTFTFLMQFYRVKTFDLFTSKEHTHVAITRMAYRRACTSTRGAAKPASVESGSAAHDTRS